MSSNTVRGLVTGQRACRIGTNQELRELYKTFDPVADIKMGECWSGLGHVVRTGQTRVDMKTLESKPEGIRKVGRFIIRWLKDAEDDLGELKVKKLRKEGK
jgi:hypothetical protein